MSKPRPIIIIRKKAGHDGHRGGAWKVAYADFVTAMMALFIVLWLMNTSDHIRKAVSGYFNDPSGKTQETGTDRAGSGDNMPLTKDNIRQLKEQIEKQVRERNDLSKLSKQIEMTVTPEGLRIELLESQDGTFFDSGSSGVNENGRELLHTLASTLSSLPNHVSIEGHTDSKPFVDDGVYGNWELSVDRANAARRVMQQEGLRHDQITQVRGYADQRLRVPQDPMDPSNRRVSLIVQYLDAPSGGAKIAKAGGEPAQAQYPQASAATTNAGAAAKQK